MHGAEHTMRAEVDNSETVFLIGYHKNVRNRLHFATVGGGVAIVDANAVHKERIWNWRGKCIQVTRGPQKARNDLFRRVVPSWQPLAVRISHRLHFAHIQSFSVMISS